jgi:hypothetical protein
MFVYYVTDFVVYENHQKLNAFIDFYKERDFSEIGQIWQGVEIIYEEMLVLKTNVS